MALNTTTSDPGLDYFGGAAAKPNTGSVTSPSWVPWSDQELAKVSDFGDAWRAEHGITKDRPEDILGTYQQLRLQGLSHDDARQGAINVLGWEGTTAQSDTKTGAGGSGGGGSTATATGGGLFNTSLYAPFTGKPPTYSPTGLPSAPQWAPPAYLPQPAIPKVDPFSYKDYALPTLEEAENQPGYKFGVQQGEKALQQSRAAQGLLRTGGTLKDILDYGRNAATQNYGNVVAQTEGVYDRNRAGAVQAYNTNYGTQFRDPYLASVAATNQTNADRFAQAQAEINQKNLGYTTDVANTQLQDERGYNSAWQQYLNSQDVFYNNQNSPFSKYLSLAQLGSSYA